MGILLSLSPHTVKGELPGLASFICWAGAGAQPKGQPKSQQRISDIPWKPHQGTHASQISRACTRAHSITKYAAGSSLGVNIYVSNGDELPTSDLLSRPPVSTLRALEGHHGMPPFFLSNHLGKDRTRPASRHEQGNLILRGKKCICCT